MNVVQRLLDRFLDRQAAQPAAPYHLRLNPGWDRAEPRDRSDTKAPFDKERRRKRNRAAERSRVRNRL